MEPWNRTKAEEKDWNISEKSEPARCQKLLYTEMFNSLHFNDELIALERIWEFLTLTMLYYIILHKQGFKFFLWVFKIRKSLIYLHF